MARALVAETARFAKSAVSLREAAADSMLHEFVESATMSSLPRIAASTSRSTAQPCCTMVGGLLLTEVDTQKLTEQQGK